jgi:DNA-directed RNA polymerase I subunit RPA1
MIMPWVRIIVINCTVPYKLHIKLYMWLCGVLFSFAGPTSDKGTTCTTCLRSSFSCPGHMGHIELPVAVVNPMFRTQLSKILRICCVKCHRTLIPG